jgi:hypothetical protein
LNPEPAACELSFAAVPQLRMVLPNIVMTYGPGLLTDDLIKMIVSPVKEALPLSFNP